MASCSRAGPCSRQESFPSLDMVGLTRGQQDPTEHGSKCFPIERPRPTRYYHGMALNPYASFLGDREPIEIITSTSIQLSKLSETLGTKRMEHSPAPGKWNAREILSHLADCEVVFAFRLRQTLADGTHVIQPFDQDKWAGQYSSYTSAEAMAVFSSVRQWNLVLIRNLPREAFSKK